MEFVSKSPNSEQEELGWHCSWLGGRGHTLSAQSKAQELLTLDATGGLEVIFVVRKSLEAWLLLTGL